MDTISQVFGDSPEGHEMGCKVREVVAKLSCMRGPASREYLAMGDNIMEACAYLGRRAFAERPAAQASHGSRADFGRFEPMQHGVSIVSQPTLAEQLGEILMAIPAGMKLNISIEQGPGDDTNAEDC